MDLFANINKFIAIDRQERNIFQIQIQIKAIFGMRHASDKDLFCGIKSTVLHKQCNTTAAHQLIVSHFKQFY